MQQNSDQDRPVSAAAVSQEGGFPKGNNDEDSSANAFADADERTRIMLDAMPIGCAFWDESHGCVDCNQAAVELFGLSSKQEYLERFFDLSPKYQPSGRLSADMAYEVIARAFATGFQRFEWLHQKLDGEPIPAEVTLVRVKRGSSYVIASYIRDMRELRRQLAQIEAANERTRIMLDATPLCCNIWDEHHNNIDCNQEAVNLFELKNKQEYLDRFFELSPEYQPSGRTSKEMAHEHITRAFESGRTRFEWMHQKLNGDPVPAEITLVRVERGDTYNVAGYTRDLRELKSTLAEIQEVNERTQIMLDATPLCCNFWDEDFRNIDCNQEAVHLFDLSSKQEYLDRFFDLSPKYQPVGRLSSELAAEYIGKAFETGRVRFEWMHQKLDGEAIPAEITLVRVKRRDKFIVAGYTRDLRELKETVGLLNNLEKLAFTDSLTGAFNRHYFMEHASRAFIQSESRNERACIVLFDLDHFKSVNDTFGHSAGDAILRGVAQKVQGALRSDDLFARYGGEEFVVYAPKASLDAARRLAERMRRAVAGAKFVYGGNEIRVTLSLGVAERSMAGGSFENFINKADAALYRAKANGRNRVES